MCSSQFLVSPFSSSTGLDRDHGIPGKMVKFRKHVLCHFANTIFHKTGIFMRGKNLTAAFQKPVQRVGEHSPDYSWRGALSRHSTLMSCRDLESRTKIHGNAIFKASAVHDRVQQYRCSNTRGRSSLVFSHRISMIVGFARAMKHEKWRVQDIG